MDERIALITGANKGIGFAVAQHLAQEGMSVLLGARDRVRGAAAAERLRGEGLNASPINIDVTNQVSIEAAADEVTQAFGRLDVLVNNAGVNGEFAGLTRPRDVDTALLRQTYETNVFAPLAVARAFLPLLRRARSGRIINLSSMLGSLAAASEPTHPLYGLNLLAYNSSKTALNAITVSLAKDLAEDGITVAAVCPGWVRTDMGGEGAPRSVEEGARIVVKLALDPAPPIGRFLDEAGPVAW